MKLLVAAAVSFAAATHSAYAGEWETTRGCRLMENESNDGDSFHVKADGEERIFRLYFVDTPETEGGGRGNQRCDGQRVGATPYMPIPNRHSAIGKPQIIRECLLSHPA